MPPSRRRTDPVEGQSALGRVLADLDAGHVADRADLGTAVRYLLAELAARAPGNTVEVRVPPYGVAQCVPGPRHARGTPPNVVECDPLAWVRLATGRLGWERAIEEGTVTASGQRSDLSAYLPLV